MGAGRDRREADGRERGERRGRAAERAAPGERGQRGRGAVAERPLQHRRREAVDDDEDQLPARVTSRACGARRGARARCRARRAARTGRTTATTYPTTGISASMATAIDALPTRKAVPPGRRPPAQRAPDDDRGRDRPDHPADERARKADPPLDEEPCERPDRERAEDRGEEPVPPAREDARKEQAGGDAEPEVMPISYQSPTAGLYGAARGRPVSGRGPYDGLRPVLRAVATGGLQPLDDLEAERGSAHAVDDAVVEAHGDVADRADHDLAVPDDRPLGRRGGGRGSRPRGG